MAGEPDMKRTALTRTTTARLTVKPKRCKSCRGQFFPASAWQTHCRADPCAAAAYDAIKASREAKEAKAHREKLADSKPLGHWHALTQRVVNAYVQARDKGKPCISCGTHITVQWEAGHWLTRGAHKELAYDVANIHLQCHHCNVWKSGAQAAYRVGLLARIGAAEVARLEGPHPTAKHTRESLAEIRRWASAEKRLLSKTGRTC